MVPHMLQLLIFLLFFSQLSCIERTSAASGNISILLQLWELKTVLNIFQIRVFLYQSICCMELKNVLNIFQIRVFLYQSICCMELKNVLNIFQIRVFLYQSICCMSNSICCMSRKIWWTLLAKIRNRWRSTYYIDHSPNLLAAALCFPAFSQLFPPFFWCKWLNDRNHLMNMVSTV